MPSTRSELKEATLAGLRWVAVARVTCETLTFGAALVLARLVPPAEFGRAAVAIVAINIAAILTFEGLGSALVQIERLRPAHLQGVALAGPVLGGAATVIVAAGAAVLGPHLFDVATVTLIQLASLAFVLAGVGVVPRAQLQRRLDFRRLSIIEVVALVPGSLTAVGLAVAGLDGEAIVLGLLVTSAATALLFTISAPWVRPRWRPGELREVLTFGSLSFSASLTYGLYRNIDYVILGAKLSAAQVGFYYRAFQLGVDYQRKISGIMARIAFPVYSRSASMEDMRAVRQRIVRLHTTLIFPALIGLAALAPVLVPFMFGPQWEPSVVPAQLLAVAGLASPVVAGLGPLMLAAGRPAPLLRFNLGALAGYATVVFLTAPHGVIAVCLGTIAVNVVKVVAVQLVLVRGVLGIPASAAWHESAPALAAGVVLAAVAFPLVAWLDGTSMPAPAILIAVAIVGALAYLVTLRIVSPAAWGDVELVWRRVVLRRRAGSGLKTAEAPG